MAPTGPIEREIKLPFPTAEEARRAVTALGASPLKNRRLQDDRLLDTAANELRSRQSVLRIRMEDGGSRLTFKGPVQPGRVKIREEHETLVGDGEVMLHVLAELGFRPWFRYQKYREEYSLPQLVVAIDDTPIGVFVELEGSEVAIDAAAARLGRSRVDYVLESYYSLFQRWRVDSGSQKRDMVFDPS